MSLGGRVRPRGRLKSRTLEAKEMKSKQGLVLVRLLK